jgi:sarcosine oxidase
VGSRPVFYDRIVVGAGAMGSAAAYFLSGHQGRTLVLERFHENHPFGSSHGRTRILRTAYSEGSEYVPLVLRARRLWLSLGKAVGTPLFRSTGVVMGGARGSPALGRAKSSARRWGLPHESFEFGRAGHRFPAFRFTPHDEALWDPAGGVLFPEKAIRAFHRLSRQRGARFRWNSPVLGWQGQSNGQIRVSTAKREYVADSMVVAAGAWMPGLVRGAAIPLAVEQQTVYWFRPRSRADRRFRGIPAFVWYVSDRGYFYGTPDFGVEVKVGGS